MVLLIFCCCFFSVVVVSLLIRRGTQRICSSHYLFPRGILLAGKNTGVSISWLGNFVIDRGFAWELLTFSSISTRAGCRKNPFPLPESSHKHTMAGQSDCACGKKTCFVPVLSLLFGRFASRDLKARGIPGWEINLISWLGNQPILSSWLGNFLCVLLGKRNR